MVAFDALEAGAREVLADERLHADGHHLCNTHSRYAGGNHRRNIRHEERPRTVIHNAAVGYREAYRVTADGLPYVFAINALSAYILTALIERPKRLVYLSSGMHHDADANLDDVLWQKRRWNGTGLRREQAP